MSNPIIHQYIPQQKDAFTIKRKLSKAISSLEEQNYTKFMEDLVEFGAYLEDFYNKKIKNGFAGDPETQEIINDPVFFKEEKFKKTEQLLHMLIPEKLALQNTFAFQAFEEGWLDESLNNRIHTLKSHLRHSTRRKVHLAMFAFAVCVKGQLVAENNVEKARQYDQKVATAIQIYKTKLQKLLSVSGKILACAMSVICGMTTAAAIIIAVAGTWPVMAIIIIASLVFATTVFHNWRLFRNVVPSLMIDVAGKDKLFEGWTDFNDEDTGEKVQLSKSRKLLLGISTLFGIAVGAVSGAVTHSFLISLGKVAIFSFLAGSAAFPPIAITCAVIVGVCIAVLMVNAFAYLLRTKNLKDIIKRPFLEVADFFNPEHERNQSKSAIRLKIEKIITYSILGVLTVAALFGLTAMQCKGVSTLGPILTKIFHAGPAVAKGVSYAVSMGVALIGQIPFVILSTARAVAHITRACSNLFAPCLNLTKTEISILTAEIYPKPTPKTRIGLGIPRLFKYAAHVISSLGNGALVVKTFHQFILSCCACISSTWGGALAPAIASNAIDTHKDIKTRATVARIMSLLDDKKVSPTRETATVKNPPANVSSSSKVRYYQKYILMNNNRGGSNHSRDSETPAAGQVTANDEYAFSTTNYPCR